jgi:hypothetical protein
LTERQTARVRRSSHGRMLTGLVQGLAPALSEILLPCLRKLQTIERRLASVEDRPGLRYRGTWDENQQYNRGDFATDRGSLWHANRATRDRPPGAAWTLACKRGRDGRDAK